ncbi:MAG: hypothetical protein JW834_04435 [Candidatus Diapherotrites archaeon]|nr:hypothetical protein [Candidatus Diapherotrites archaeon]
MLEMSGVLKEGRDGGYIIHAYDTPIILLDKKHAPTQQFLRAFGRKMLGEKVNVVIIEQHDNWWLGQIHPEALKKKGFGRT